MSLPTLEALAAITIWAISFIFVKVTLREIAPATLIALRFSLGALLVGAAAVWRGELRQLRRSDLPRLALAGLVGITLQQTLQVSGQALAEAGVAAFLASSAPAFIVALGALMLRERPGLSQVAGVALATLGALVVATGGDLAGLARGQWGTPGSLLVLASAVVWALFTILNKKLVRGRPTTLMTAGLFAFGALFSLPLFIYEQGWRDLPRLSLAGWSGVLYVGVLSTSVAYLVNGHALKRLSAARVAAIQNLEPLIAVSAAALILGERITPAMLLGGAGILAGVFLAERGAADALIPAATKIVNEWRNE